MRKAVEKILEKIKRDKRIAAIVCVGLAGIILLTLSELMPQGKDVTEKSDKEPVSDIRDSYEDDIEKRLTSIVSVINGAGRTEVMVTLASGDENVYAVKEKSNDGSKEREYIVIDSDNNESGLLLKVMNLKSGALRLYARERILPKSDRRLFRRFPPFSESAQIE